MSTIGKSFFSRIGPVLLALTSAAWGCADSEIRHDGGEGPIVVFAAASSTDVLSRLAKAYERRTGVRVQCSFAASSTLARQIEAGAPADVYLSANPEWMDRLESRKLVERRRDLLSNRLVLIAPPGREFDVVMERGFAFGSAFEGRLALGDPAHVPAGQYAREALESLGWWNQIEDRLIPAMDVRDALRVVALGEAGTGIVYSTDAATSEQVRVIGAFPQETYSPIRYPVALVKGASSDAGEFVNFLFTDEARAVFEDAGFERIDVR